MDELVQAAQFTCPARGQRRQLLTGRHRLCPRLKHLRQDARWVGVNAHLVGIAGAVIALASGCMNGAGIMISDSCAMIRSCPLGSALRSRSVASAARTLVR